jgi:hypothetical protein
MAKIITLNNSDEEILAQILDKEITVFEDIQGSKICVNWDGSKFTIKPKSIQNEPINLVDLAMQNFYNPAFEYFNNLDTRVKSLLNRNWWFVFEYFPDNQPANIEYAKLPKNKLVLTAIAKSGKFNYSLEELEEYARLLGTDPLPIIFKGKLSAEAKEAIKYFLNTSEKDLEYVFGEKSFAFFFYKILNPVSTGSFLMDDEFQKNVEKLIIKTDDSEASFQILNPLYTRISALNSTEFVEVYTLLLINFLNFCQSVDYDTIKLNGTKRHEVYLYLMSKLFNIYVTEVKEDLINFDFTIPEFFDKHKFRINKELVPNKLTRTYIEEDKKLEYIFKIILGSFMTKKRKPMGVFTQSTIDIFNRFVDKINSTIDEFLNKKSEKELTKSQLVDFSKWFDLKVDQDAEGEVYPDVWNEIVDKSKDKKEKGKPKEEVEKK